MTGRGLALRGRAMVMGIGLLTLSLFTLTGCTGTGLNSFGLGGCQSDSSCGDGEICINQECTAMSGDICTLDTECGFGEVCLDGVCGMAEEIPATDCTQTAQCPETQFCDQVQSICVALSDGLCRNPGQCPQDRPVCANGDNSANAGRCVECLTDSHCGGGGSCVNPGVCEGGTGPGPATEPEAEVCPENASETADGCTCNPGYEEDGERCVPTGTPEPGPQGPSIPNPEPAPEAVPEPAPDAEPETGSDVCEDNGWYDDAVCDTFCPLPDPDCDETNEPAPSPGSEPSPSPGSEPAPSPEPSPEPPAGECTTDTTCWTQYSTNYSCESNECVCDVLWLTIWVCDLDETVDTAACECVGGQTPAPIAENESCVENETTLECAEGLACIYGTNADGDPSYGTCKQRCTADSECPGRECVEGFLTGGDGICGTPMAAGDNGCEQWTAGDSFCFDATAGDGDAFIDCVDNTCRHICDWDGRADPALSCDAAGGSCGAVTEEYDDLTVSVATCQ